MNSGVPGSVVRVAASLCSSLTLNPSLPPLLPLLPPMDDLLDLSWSAAPPAPPQKPQPAFELLARPAPAASYSPSPSPSPAPAPPAKPAAAAHSDAFSSLIAVPAARAEQGKHMTMAEKQAAIAQEKRRKDEAQRAQFAADGAFWDSLGSRSMTATPPPDSLPRDSLDDLLQPPHGTFWDQYGASDLLSASSQPASQPPSHAHSPAPPPPPPPAAAAPADPFDFDTFENTLNGSATASLASKSGETSGIRTPLSTLDFGDGDPADDLLGDPADDLLGELGKPAPKPAQVCTHYTICLSSLTSHLAPFPRTTHKPRIVSSTPYCRPNRRNGLCACASSTGARKNVDWCRRPGSARPSSRWCRTQRINA